MQQGEVFSNYWGKQMVNMNTILSPGHAVLTIHNVYLYDLNSPPLVPILTQPNSAELFTNSF